MITGQDVLGGLKSYWPLVLFGGVAGWFFKGKTWQGAALGATVGATVAIGTTFVKGIGAGGGVQAAQAQAAVNPCQAAANRVNAAMQQRARLSKLAQLTAAEQRACTAAGGVIQYRQLGTLKQPVGCACTR